MPSFQGVAARCLWYLLLGLTCLEWQELVPDEVCFALKLDWSTFLYGLPLCSFGPRLDLAQSHHPPAAAVRVLLLVFCCLCAAAIAWLLSRISAAFHLD